MKRIRQKLIAYSDWIVDDTTGVSPWQIMLLDVVKWTIRIAFVPLWALIGIVMLTCAGVSAWYDFAKERVKP